MTPRILCLLNVGDEPRRCALPLARLAAERGEVVVATTARAGTVALGDLELAPREGLAIRIG